MLCASRNNLSTKIARNEFSIVAEAKFLARSTVTEYKVAEKSGAPFGLIIIGNLSPEVLIIVVIRYLLLIMMKHWLYIFMYFVFA